MRFIMVRHCGMALAAASIFAVLFHCTAAEGQDVSFCSLLLSKAVLQAHTNFNAVYEFDVDEHGVPINVKPVAKQFTKPEDVQACLERWNLPQSASKHLVAVFEWHHGIGWTKLAISGPEVSLTIHLTGERCPYYAKGTINSAEKAKPMSTAR